MTAERAVRLHQEFLDESEHLIQCYHAQLDHKHPGDRQKHGPSWIAIPDTPATRAVIEEARELVRFNHEDGDVIRALLSLLETEERPA